MTFNWDFPYASQRMPVLARNVVATSQPLAAQAGLQALAKGGNAVDAALAAAVALTVVEPTGNEEPGVKFGCCSVACPQASVAVGAVHSPMPSQLTPDALTLKSVGQPAICGGVTSLTVTVSEQTAELPALSVAVKNTCVVPVLKVLPGGT